MRKSVNITLCLNISIMKKLVNISAVINVIVLTLIIIFSVSCDGKLQKENSDNSTENISPESFVFSNTSGMVNAGANLRIDFNKKFDLINSHQSEINNDIVWLKPELKGKLIYNGNSSLIFKPDELMQRGKEYTCVVDLSKLFNDIPDNLEYTFKFGVIQLDVSVMANEFESHISDDKKLNYIDGKIIGSDDLVIDDINNIINAEQDGKRLTVIKLASDKKEVILFRIENIERKIDESEVDIFWNAKSLGSSDKGEITKTIYPIGIFKLTDIKVVNTPDQYIKLSFSDNIDKNMNLDGIVYVVGNKDYKLDVNTNNIIIYTNNYQTGDANVVIKKQLKNTVGKKLETDYLKEIHFGQIEPAVEFIDDGVIMPGDDNWQLHFKAVNLSKVDIIIYKILPQNIMQFLQVNDIGGDYQLERVAKLVSKNLFVLCPDAESNNHNWNTYSVDLSNMINDDKSGLYKVRIRFKKEYSLYECAENNIDDGNTESYYGYYDYYKSDYYYPPNYQWEYRNNPCSGSYYSYDRFIQKNVLASNIGLTTKQNGDSSFIVIANSLLTSEPMGEVKISVYEYAQDILKTKVTRKDGVAEFNTLGNSWLVVAEKGDDIAYLKIFGGNSLSYSRFETGGVIPNEGINAFIYGDRGVWRPGDSLFLTIIVNDVTGNIPDNHPVSMELYNPKSKLIYEMTSKNGENGFYTFAVPTDSEDITGNWRAKFIVGNAVFYKRIKIENLKPNRLKINLDFNKEMLLPEGNKGNIDVVWLHGGIAGDLRAQINATLRPVITKFDGYNDYTFNDIGKVFRSDEFVMLDKNVDNQGKLSFDVEMPSMYNAPGKLKVNLVTRVYEKSGDFSISPSSIIYSPFEKYVGVMTPKTAEGDEYLEVDKSQTFKVVVLNNDGQKVACDKLTVEIFKLDWSWWYSYNNNNSPGYIQANYSNRVYSKDIVAKNGSAEFDFEISYPMWGNYFVRVTDVSGGHSSGNVFYMDWPSWYSRNNRNAPGDAGLLSLSSDKETYKIGDIAKVSFPTPQNATVIVSLEKNKRILHTWNTSSSEKETVIDFEITKEMLPNIYASITVIQPVDNVNDLPVRLYGVLPILVEDVETVLKPVIKAPEVIKPNTNYNICISEKNGTAMTYTIAVVDDGLLDLTNFRTPDPHATFFAKQALEVVTWDMYDQVAKSFKGNVLRTFAVGGGFASEEDSDVKKNKANRFKPVVSFIGPITLKEGDSSLHSIRMKNYIGSVRVMVIAGNDYAFGSSQKTIPVKQDLMTIVTAPRKLSPGEKAVIPITVFRMNENIKNVNIKISGNEAFSIPDKELTLKMEDHENLANFVVDVNDFEGIGKLSVMVTSGKYFAYDSIELNVANPNNRVYKVDNFMLKPGDSLAKISDYPGTVNTHKFNLSVSAMPQINLEKRLNFLIKYPYYCVEQVTSAAFPQLYLSNMVKLGEKQQQKVEKHIVAAIGQLSKMQLLSGGFSYWPDDGSLSDWGTSYAGHFLLVAKEKGYDISPSMLNKWAEYQLSTSDSWSAAYYNDGMLKNDLNQAYRLFTLAVYNEPNTGAMNRMREMKGMHPVAKYMLASAYALIGQKAIGKELIKNVTWENATRDYYRSSYGSELRDKAIVAQSLFLLDDNNAVPMLMDVAESLRSEYWYSTQTTAFSLITMALFMENANEANAYSFKYQWRGDYSDTIIPVKPIFSKQLEASNDGETLRIKNTSQANVFVTVTTSGIPEMKEFTTKEKNLEISTMFFDMSGEEINISEIQQGTDFYEEVKVTNPGIYGSLDNLALSQIFPSGWEIMNTRMFDMGSEIVSDNADYIDYKDDRVNFFFGLKKGESKKFVVLLNASYKGTYYLPVSGCMDMYNNNISAYSGGKWIDIQ